MATSEAKEIKKQEILVRFSIISYKNRLRVKNGPKNLKNVSPENLGKNKEFTALGKSQRSL